MPHASQDNFMSALAHSDMFSDVIKTLMILFLIAYLDERRRTPTMHEVVIATVVVVFYWAVIYPMFPGGDTAAAAKEAAPSPTD